MALFALLQSQNVCGVKLALPTLSKILLCTDAQ